MSAREEMSAIAMVMEADETQKRGEMEQKHSKCDRNDGIKGWIGEVVEGQRGHIHTLLIFPLALKEQELVTALYE